MPQGERPAPDLDWACKHLHGFAERKEGIDALKADEERYRQQPGYVPNTRPRP